MKPQLQRFLDYLAHERGLSPRTVAAYRRDLEHLAKFLDEAGVDQVRDIDEHHVRALVASRHRQGQSGRSLQRLHETCRLGRTRLSGRNSPRRSPAGAQPTLFQMRRPQK